MFVFSAWPSTGALWEVKQAWSEPAVDRPAGRSLSCPPDRPGSLESSAPPLLPLSRPRRPRHRPPRRSLRSAPPRPRRPRL